MSKITEFWHKVLRENKSFKEALDELGCSLADLAEWWEMPEFQEKYIQWERANKLLVEEQIAKSAIEKGRVVAGLKFLAAVEPDKWSDRLRIKQEGGGLHIQIAFAWQPQGEKALVQGKIMELQSFKPPALEPAKVNEGD